MLKGTIFLSGVATILKSQKNFFWWFSNCRILSRKMSEQNTCAIRSGSESTDQENLAQETAAMKRKTETETADDGGVKKLKTDSSESKEHKGDEMGDGDISTLDKKSAETQNNNDRQKKEELQDKIEERQAPNTDAKDDAKYQQSAALLPFVRKKKVVMLLAYCGEGYNGMQRNPDVKTIEDDLINALFKAGVITEDGRDNPGKMSFQRAARTDKGVSAARQIVSLKMILVDGVVDLINSHLPPVIRVFTYKRTTRNFDSKNNCSARTYEYLLPTFAFAPTIIKTRKDYRITEDVLAKVNEILQLFIGTHNYHNFTSGKKPCDPSSKRYIMKVECDDKPFEQDGMEFMSLRIKGQSFMLHQIRKMIGLTIAIVRSMTGKEAVNRAWDYAKMDVPRAPGLGLMLDQVHFDHYNRKFGKDGIHESLEWEEFEDDIKKFKHEFIYQRIIEVERKEGAMMRWLNTLTQHSYSSEGMEEPKGQEIPTSKETSTSSKESVVEDKVTADQEVS